jgi:asparagine synthase (glutamine-hydrolysing)
MTMATSLECRVPLLDHELVELAARMPQDVKIRGGRLKHTLKEALVDVLPDDILNRPKRGFGMPMGAWLKRSLRPMLSHLLSDRAVARRGWFEIDQVRAVIASHEAGRTDGTEPLLALMNLEIWSRLYLDRRSADDIAAELKEALS